MLPSTESKNRSFINGNDLNTASGICIGHIYIIRSDLAVKKEATLETNFTWNLEGKNERAL